MQTTKTEHLWLNLGCGDDLRKDFSNVDTDRAFGIPAFGQFAKNGFFCYATDLILPWPWPDSSVDYILAKDIIEHLPDKIHTMNEAWRVLKNKGVILIEVPTTDGHGAFQDPTHVSYWNRNSFWYFEAGNVYRERFAKSYGIQAAFKVLQEGITDTPDGPKLVIALEAVK